MTATKRYDVDNPSTAPSLNAAHISHFALLLSTISLHVCNILFSLINSWWSEYGLPCILTETSGDACGTLEI